MKLFGNDHLSVAESLNNLASILFVQRCATVLKLIV